MTTSPRTFPEDGLDCVDNKKWIMGMEKSTSMLEISAVCDMIQFGEAMEALEIESAEDESRLPKKKLLASERGDAQVDGGFFIDTSDHPEEEDVGSGFLCLSSSPDSVAGPPPHDETPSRGSGMRRVMSAVSLSGRQQRCGSLSASLQDSIHTISEEENFHDIDEGPKTGDNPNILGEDGDQNGDESLKSNLEGNESPESEANAPDNSKPSKRDNSLSNLTSSLTSSVSSTGSDGMPLRSSMKGSRNNLLRASINSLDASDHSGDRSRRGSMKRNVSFSSLEIRSYPMTLGDAPSSNGPAVSLDWDHDPSQTETYDVDEYEGYRADGYPRRNRLEMIMPPSHRQYLLMREAGLTRGEIGRAVEEARRTVRNRAKTNRMCRLGLGPAEEALERTRRRLSLKKWRRS